MARNAAKLRLSQSQKTINNLQFFLPPPPALCVSRWLLLIESWIARWVSQHDRQFKMVKFLLNSLLFRVLVSANPGKRVEVQVLAKMTMTTTISSRIRIRVNLTLIQLLHHRHIISDKRKYISEICQQSKAAIIWSYPPSFIHPQPVTLLRYARVPFWQKLTQVSFWADQAVKLDIPRNKRHWTCARDTIRFIHSHGSSQRRVLPWTKPTFFIFISCFVHPESPLRIE